MSFYLDASVILPTLVKEAASPAVERFLYAATRALVVSDFAAAEVASGVSRLLRMGALDLTTARGRLDTFDEWRAAATLNLDFGASDARLANVLARRFDLALRAPDALHLAACRRGEHELVTLDRRVVAAATELGVKVIAPGL